MTICIRERLTRILIVIFLAVFALFLSSSGEFYTGCRQLREDMLRLHVLAQSDSAEDQALKLAVRDRILQESAAWPTGGKAEMTAYLSANLDRIEAAAGETLAELGCSLPVKAELTRCFFDTRVYGERTVPAGKYDALRVIIGEGAGQNWWCVLYPPLCLPAAEGEAVLDGSFTPEEKAVLSSPPRYRIRFLTVELAEKFLSWLRR